MRAAETLSASCGQAFAGDTAAASSTSSALVDPCKLMNHWQSHAGCEEAVESSAGRALSSGYPVTSEWWPRQAQYRAALSTGNAVDCAVQYASCALRRTEGRIADAVAPSPKDSGSANFLITTATMPVTEEHDVGALFHTDISQQTSTPTDATPSCGLIYQPSAT